MDQLLSMGFDRDACEIALESTGGGLEAALEILLGVVPSAALPQPAPTSPLPPIPHHTQAQEESDEGHMLTLAVSQYSYLGGSGVVGASSACTAIAAMTASKVLSAPPLTMLDYGTAATDELRTLLTQSMEEGVHLATTCQTEFDQDHLSLEEVWSVHGPMQRACRPLGGAARTLGIAVESQQGLWGEECMYDICRQMENAANASSADQSVKRSIAVVLIKPPETIVLMYFPSIKIDGTKQPACWSVFDSHSRPHMSLAGASLFRSKNRHTLVQFVLALLPAFPTDIGNDDDMMIQLSYNAVEYLVLSASTNLISLVTENTSAAAAAPAATTNTDGTSVAIVEQTLD